MKFTIAAALGFASTVSADRTFTVYNACPFTIWPAIFTDLNVGSATPNVATGWEAPARSTKTFSVPDNWKAAATATSQGTPDLKVALTEAAMEVLSVTPTPAQVYLLRSTLAEFTLSGFNGDDYYDVSVVDGYNLPMRITNTAGCHVADCPVDLGPNCPPNLKGPFDSTGFPVGCKSDCLVDPNPGNSPSCCTGSHNTPATCPKSGVPHYNYFKGNCPNSYVYAYDESSGTALWTCPASKTPNYTITFCP
ncbi:hypothetical protein FRB90_012644 [Tulasnella sp. 427]|nr:hypothetical protein FRB90_012644 [Tulasnella sp. 427]